MPEPKSLIRDIELDSQTRTSTAPGLVPAARYFVLVVAIDHYPPAQKDDNGNVVKPGFDALNNPVFDANNLLRVLHEKYDMGIPDAAGTTDLRVQDPRYRNHPFPIPVFDTKYCCCLYNEEATLAKVAPKIQEFYDTADKDDAFLFYFAGHGFKNLGGGLCLYENDRSSPLPGYHYTAFLNPFGNYLAERKCRDLLVIFDCCYSGEIVLGNQPSNLEQFFSRKAIASCGNDKKAGDGFPLKGSPFANALTATLNNNREDLLPASSLIRPIDLILRQNPVADQDGNEIPQKVMSGTPPGITVNGLGDFTFPLKKIIAEAIPAQLLAESFISHLNFDLAKERLKAEFFDAVTDDLTIISTCAYDFDAHQLMRTVMLRYIKDKFRVDLRIGKPIIVWPDTVMEGDFWLALAKTLGVEIPALLLMRQPRNQSQPPDITQKLDAAMEKLVRDVMTNLFGQIRRDESYKTQNFAPPSCPLILSVGYRSNGPETKDKLIGFCESFFNAFQARKAEAEFKNASLEKLYLIFSDIREGDAEWINRTELLRVFKEKPRVCVAPVLKKNEIVKGHFEAWKTELLNASKSGELPGFEASSIEKIAPFNDMKNAFEILEIIALLSQEFRVETYKINEQLGIIPNTTRS